MDLKFLKGVGDKRAEAFEKIGIKTLDDFINFIPRTYIKKIPVRQIPQNLSENILVSGEIIDVRYPRKDNHPLEVTLFDRSGSVEIPIFGASEFRSKQFRIKVDKENFSSKLKVSCRDHIKINPSDAFDTGFLKFTYIPLYELSGILKKTWIRPLLLSKIVFNAFSTLLKSDPDYIMETLPEALLKECKLISKKEAVLRASH